uniref:Ig-like domain-containing protein n=1 Tax=Anolis carolinensis TaxID=28377 RepID=A0A803TSD0_ANOCA
MLLLPIISFLGLCIFGEGCNTLLCLLSDSESQLVVTQPSSLSKPLGSEVRIPCAMNSGYSISKERARWYQQKSGGTPRFIYHYFTSSDQGRGSGVPERFSVSPDSGNTGYLTITNTQAEDEAEYYCGRWNNAGILLHSDQILWGSGRKTFQ